MILKEKIPKIVLTGGPCGGKTTGLSYLTDRFSGQGFSVFIVPEAATMLMKNGLDRKKINTIEEILAFQKAVFDTQYSLEKIIGEGAGKILPDKKKIILCDRGMMDSLAYTPDLKYFEKMAAEKGYNLDSLRNSYDAVIHLTTAADGAEKFYTCQNNSARLEMNIKDAMESDLKTRKAWDGHPHFVVIDNSTDFTTKMERSFTAIQEFLDSKLV